MVPLVWTALFHRRWQTASVLGAIVAVEVAASLTPTMEPDAVIARRVVLWAALGTVIAFATHELREQNQRSRQETAALQDQLTGLTVAKDRDRIAADLQDNVVQQLLAAGMNLQSTAMLATEPEVRKRALETAGDAAHADAARCPGSDHLAGDTETRRHNRERDRLHG